MRQPVFPICDNKDADQLCSNCAADQRPCFGYILYVMCKLWVSFVQRCFCDENLNIIPSAFSEIITIFLGCQRIPTLIFEYSCGYSKNILIFDGEIDII